MEERRGWSREIPGTSCVTCRANRGEIPAPGGVIYEDELWRLEHAFEPIPMVGWLVLKPLRHVDGVADLSPDEAGRLGALLRRTARAMTEVIHPVKVYVSIFGESVDHLHVHLIPRRASAPAERLGPWVFHDLDQAHREGRNLGDVGEAERVAAAIRERLQSDDRRGF